MGLVQYTPNTQAAGLTGRKTAIPYNKMFMAQLPSARQYLADEALRLQKEEEFQQSMALQRKMQEAQEKQANTDALIKTGNLALEVGKLTKDQWLPTLKQTGAEILGKIIPNFGVDQAAQIAMNMAVNAAPDVAQFAAPVLADATRGTIAPIVNEQLAPAAAEALTGTISDAALQTGAEAAGKGLVNSLGQTITSLAANIGNYMNPWAAVAHAAGELGGWGLEVLGDKNDAPWVSLLGRTFQDATSGGGVAKPIVEEIFDADTARGLNETMDVFNPIGAALFDGKIGNLWDNAVEGPAKQGGFITGLPGHLAAGIYNEIWGESPVANAVMTLLEPAGGLINNIASAIKKACVIITACTSDNSAEVAIARAYRDKYLSQRQLRGYYMIAEKLVPRMVKSTRLTRFIKNWLVDPLISYGHHVLVKSMPAPTIYARCVTNLFLGLIACIGRTRKQFTRANGEVI
jgi:hypothetical protein